PPRSRRARAASESGTCAWMTSQKPGWARCVPYNRDDTSDLYWGAAAPYEGVLLGVAGARRRGTSGAAGIPGLERPCPHVKLTEYGGLRCRNPPPLAAPDQP